MNNRYWWGYKLMLCHLKLIVTPCIDWYVPGRFNPNEYFDLWIDLIAVLFNQFNKYQNWAESMVPFSADIVIQNRWISQSETSVRTICDVVNIYSLPHALVSDDQNVTSPVFLSIVRLPRYLAMNEPCRALGCDLIILSCFYYPLDKLSVFPGQRLVTMNAVYLWRHFRMRNTAP